MHASQRPPDHTLSGLLLLLHGFFIAGLVYWYYCGFYVISWCLAAIFTVGGGLGVTLAYHRMLTHKSFVCESVFLRRLLIYFGGLLQDAQSWVANHKAHHAYTDTEKDPHSPYWPYNGGWRGGWWAHMSWLSRIYTPPADILNHKDIQNVDMCWEHNWHIWFVASGFLLPFLLGGWYGLAINGRNGFFTYGFDSFLLAGVLRAVASLHVTCSINSLGHMIGWHARKPTDRFYSKDSSRNNALLATVSFGEGNHGDHHLYQNSARIGRLDPSWPVILFFEKLGIFTNVNRPAWMILKRIK